MNKVQDVVTYMYFSNENSNTSFFILTFACTIFRCLLFDVQFWRCQNSEESLLFVVAKCKYLEISTVFLLVTRIKSVIYVNHKEKKIVHFSGEWIIPSSKVEIKFYTTNNLPKFSLIRVISFFLWDMSFSLIFKPLKAWGEKRTICNYHSYSSVWAIMGCRDKNSGKYILLILYYYLLWLLLNYSYIYFECFIALVFRVQFQHVTFIGRTGKR